MGHYDNCYESEARKEREREAKERKNRKARLLRKIEGVPTRKILIDILMDETEKYVDPAD